MVLLYFRALFLLQFHVRSCQPTVTLWTMLCKIFMSYLRVSGKITNASTCWKHIFTTVEFILQRQGMRAAFNFPDRQNPFLDTAKRPYFTYSSPSYYLEVTHLLNFCIKDIT